MSSFGSPAASYRRWLCLQLMSWSSRGAMSRSGAGRDARDGAQRIGQARARAQRGAGDDRARAELGQRIADLPHAVGDGVVELGEGGIGDDRRHRQVGSRHDGVYEVDFDSSKDVLKQFRVQSQSTLIVFKGANEVGRSTGDTNPASIKALVSKGL